MWTWVVGGCQADFKGQAARVRAVRGWDGQGLVVTAWCIAPGGAGESARQAQLLLALGQRITSQEKVQELEVVREPAAQALV